MSTVKRRAKREVIPGMRAPPRPKQIPIEKMSVDDLRTQFNRNETLLKATSASSSTYVERITAEQAKIKARIVEIEGVKTIQREMKKVSLDEDNSMAIDKPEPYVSPAMLAKQKALAAWGQTSGAQKTSTMSLQEAIELEQRAYTIEQERRTRQLERKERLSMPKQYEGPGTALTREEYEAKVWAFMTYKPSESDMEDDDDDDDDDDDNEDPSTWFEDDQDDGLKGQNIILPDPEDLADIIRMDESKFQYSSFYEPHEDGD